VTRSLIKKHRAQQQPTEAAAEVPHADPYVAIDQDLAPMFFEEPAPGPTQGELDAEGSRLTELRAILEGVS
jgi:hypothetical protein